MTENGTTHLQLLQNGCSLFDLTALLFNVGQSLSESRTLYLYINLPRTTQPRVIYQ